MSLAQLPLRTEPLVDEQRFITLPYQAFFEGLASGDLGTSFTPLFTNLTETGTATITGVYYRLGVKLCAFVIVITPATDTSAVAGSTYCNFPLTFTKQGFAVSIIDSSAAVAGITTTGRIYTGTWTAQTVPVTIMGIGEVQ
jgi:hypothetical protein